MKQIITDFMAIRYVAPKTSVISVEAEGILCGSGGIGSTHEGFGDGGDGSSDGFLDGGSFDL